MSKKSIPVMSILYMCLILLFLSACTPVEVQGTAKPLEEPADITSIPISPVVTQNPVGVATESVDAPGGDSSDVPGSAAVELTPDPVLELPSLDMVTAERNPLLYDFVNGCMGWHLPIDEGTRGLGLYILRHVTASHILYCSAYITQGDIIFPVRGSEIIRMELDASQLESFDSCMGNLSELDIWHEDGWTVYMCGNNNYQVFNETGIIFDGGQNVPLGTAAQFEINGSGWPTEWLRREPYASAIWESTGIDFTDPWWDTCNYQGRYDIVQTGHDNGISYWVVCTNIKEFTMYDSNGGAYTGMTWWDLKVLCNDMAYDIPGLYTHNSWQPGD